MEIWQYLLLIGSVILGGTLSTVGKPEAMHKLLPLLLSFSGAYLIGIVALELIPETFGYSEGSPGFFLLLGFLIQLLLENLSQGVEHGHVHAHAHAKQSYGLQVLLGLSLHAFLEGIPLANQGVVEVHGHAHGSGEHLIYGIVLHKLPAAFALGLLLRSSGYSRSFRWFCLVVFALMSPLGAGLGQELMVSEAWHHNILALVIGSFLHISTTILFEADSGDHHRISYRKLGVIVMGMGLAYLSGH